MSILLETTAIKMLSVLFFSSFIELLTLPLYSPICAFTATTPLSKPALIGETVSLSYVEATSPNGTVHFFICVLYLLKSFVKQVE